MPLLALILCDGRGGDAGGLHTALERRTFAGHPDIAFEIPAMTIPEMILAVATAALLFAGCIAVPLSRPVQNDATPLQGVLEGPRSFRSAHLVCGHRCAIRH